MQHQWALQDINSIGDARFWLYEFTGDEPPFTGKFFISPGEMAMNPGLVSQPLQAINANKLYYLMSSTPLRLKSNNGIEVAPICGNRRVEGIEKCDNVAGCSDNCQPKTGYDCDQSQNTCHIIIPDLPDINGQQSSANSIASEERSSSNSEEGSSSNTTAINTNNIKHLQEISNLRDPQSSYVQDNAFNPQVKWISSNRAVAIWAQANVDTSRSSKKNVIIMGRTYSTESGWGNAMRISGDYVTTQMCKAGRLVDFCVQPQLTVDANGVAHAHWLFADVVDNRKQQFILTSTLNGSDWSNPIKIGGGTYNPGVENIAESRPSVAFSKDGKGMATWLQTHNNDMHVTISRYNGTQWSIPEPIAIAHTTNQLQNGFSIWTQGPQIGADDAGNFTIAYTNNGSATSQRSDLLSIRYESNTWQDPVIIDNDDANWPGTSYSYSGGTYTPAVSDFLLHVADNGHAVLAFVQGAKWTDMQKIEARPVMRVSTYTPNQGWSSPSDIDTFKSEGYPRGQGIIAMDALIDSNNTAHIMWTQDCENSQYLIPCIAKNYYTKATGSSWQPVSMSSDIAPANMSLGTDGSVYSIWMGYDEEESKVYPRNIEVGKLTPSGWNITRFEDKNKDHRSIEGAQITINPQGNPLAIWVQQKFFDIEEYIGQARHVYNTVVNGGEFTISQ